MQVYIIQGLNGVQSSFSVIGAKSKQMALERAKKINGGFVYTVVDVVDGERFLRDLGLTRPVCLVGATKKMNAEENIRFLKVIKDKVGDVKISEAIKKL